jgi:alkaline phosphatase D
LRSNIEGKSKSSRFKPIPLPAIHLVPIVHVEVAGLRSNREYFYRFHTSSATSPVGRTRTAPALDHDLDRLRFAFTSCQQYEQGYYLAYRDIAKQDLDAVVFLGDYIYNHSGTNPELVRKHPVKNTKKLSDFRRQYSAYKSDPDLQAAHAAHPWIVTLDDHEIENNWAGDHSHTKENFLAVRTAGFQAYYENMPLRIGAKPDGSHMQLYRTVNYGKLAQFTVLDTRQYRTPQPCGDDGKPACAEEFDPKATMMGAAQEEWFAKVMSQSPAQWNIVANQVFIAQNKSPQKEGPPTFNMDSWDGYVEARNRLIEYLKTSRPRNPIFITGDNHQTWVNNLKTDFNRPDSETVAVEIVGTSVTSGGDGAPRNDQYDTIMPENRHIIYNSNYRGYLLCSLNRSAMHSDLRITEKVTQQNAPVKTAARFVVESGRPGIHQI